MYIKIFYIISYLIKINKTYLLIDNNVLHIRLSMNHLSCIRHSYLLTTAIINIQISSIKRIFLELYKP